MQCTLLIPHLLWPVAATDEAGGRFRLRIVEQVLARARWQQFSAIPVEGWLCQAFEVERQQDWPVAPLTLTRDGVAPNDSYWLRADPVHVRAEHEGLRLADSSVGGISREEADALIAALNEHFGGDAMMFLAPHPERWYLNVVPAPAITTRTITEAAGADIRRLLPAGPDALKWHRLCNEIQMLLHAHPVNDDREARGAAPINSIWVWGGGTCPRVPGRHFCKVWSTDPLAHILATAAGIDSSPTSAAASEWLASVRHGSCDSHLVVLDQLAAPARYGDLDAWRALAAALERDWIAPLAAAVANRSVQRLAVVSLDRDGCGRFDLTAINQWRFWRRRQPLAAYCPR